MPAAVDMDVEPGAARPQPIRRYRHVSSPESLRLSWTRESIDSAMLRMVETFAARIRMDVELDRVVWPSIPATVLRVRQLVQDSESATDDICEAIAADPALATRIVKAANSAAFAGASSCNNLKRAVVRLGNAVIENVALILTVARVFSVGKRAIIQSHLARLWDHSTRVAALSEVLTERAAHLQRDVVLLGGLIHDVGKIPVLVQAQKYPTLIKNPVLLDALVGSLHTELGTAVLESWHLPPELVAVAAEHEELEADRPGLASCLDVVLVANALSNFHERDLPVPAHLYALPTFHKLSVTADDESTLLSEADARRSAFSQIMQ